MKKFITFCAAFLSLLAASSESLAKGERVGFPACHAQVAEDHQAVADANRTLRLLVYSGADHSAIREVAAAANSLCVAALARLNERDYPCTLTYERETFTIGRLVIPSHCEEVSSIVQQLN